MNNLAFVVGFPRSGTTFLATKLGELADCAATPETRFFAEAVNERLIFSRKLTAREIREEVVPLRRMQDLDLDLASLFTEPDDQRIDALVVFERIMHAFAREHGVGTVIEKSPAHTYFARSLLEWYPHAKVIAIVRDGRDAMLSLRETPWGDRPTKWYAADWIYRQKLIEKAADLHPDRVRIVRFEDLVANQDSVIADLARFLGLDASSDREPSKIKTIPDWEARWKRRAAGEADASRAGRWATQGDHAEMTAFTAIAGDKLRSLGYEAEPSTMAGRVRALFHPIRHQAKRLARKAMILVGLGNRVSSERGVEKRLGVASESEAV
jgi:hypothetical protein